MTQVLDVFLEGVERPVASLTRAEDLSLIFRYTDVGLEAGVPLSLSLPLRDTHYDDPAARAFFGNLLNENDELDWVMKRHGIARNDIAGLLYHLGRDLPGALSCVPAGDGPGKRPGLLASDYDILSEESLAEIMASLRTRRRLPESVRDPSPLAGVQGKLALTELPGGQFGLPKPGLGVPTTHILKVPRDGEDALVDQEHALMELARQVLRRNAVAETRVLNCRGERGLLIRRFDRVVEAGTVRRLHQEDFAQALGLPDTLKYERSGLDPQRRFDAKAIGRVLSATSAPAQGRFQLIEATLFNLAVGNTDNHAKNHALLYPQGGGAPYLAPLYDIVPIRLDPHVTHDFAFRIGAAGSMAALTKEDLDQLCSDIGIRRLTGSPRSGLERVLQDVADEIASFAGHRKILGDMIADQLLAMLERVGLSIDVPERDYFALSGGGFQIRS